MIPQDLNNPRDIRVVLQWRHGDRDQLDGQQQKTDPHHRLPGAAPLDAFTEHVHRDAGSQKHGVVDKKLERQQLHRQREPDVCAEHQREHLLERHEPAGNRLHRQQRHRRAAGCEDGNQTAGE